MPVLLPLLPEPVPFDVGVWLLPAVGDAPTVGVALLVAVVVTVTVGVVVGVTAGVTVTVGDGVGDGVTVGEGDTTGAL